MSDQPTRAHLQVHGVDVDVQHHVTVTFPPSLGGDTVKVPTALRNTPEGIVLALNLDAVARRTLDDPRIYSAVADSLARAREGHYQQPSMRKRAR